MTDSTITAIVLEPASRSVAPRSVGLVVDDQVVAWGDFGAPGGPLGSPELVTRWHLAVSDALVGQRLDETFATFTGRLDSIAPGSVTVEYPGLRLAVEQALVFAMAHAHGSPAADMLMRVLDKTTDRSAASPTLILEVDNHVATATVVQRMMSLAPDGLGYRLAAGQPADSIGKSGEFLQRFVRELAMLLLGRDYPADSPPVIYLGLNGALGDLTSDPWRELGHVLGHMNGLERASGALALWLEDPLVIDDEIMHAAALNQLRDYMRVRDMDTRIIGRAHTNQLEGLQMLCETEAIDGACLSIEEWGGLARLHDAVIMLQDAGKRPILTNRTLSTPGQVEFLLDVATALQADAVLVGMGNGDGNLGELAVSRAGRYRLESEFFQGNVSGQGRSGR